MIIALPVPILLFGMFLIMLCTVMPSILLFVLIIKRDERAVERSQQPRRETPYAPEYMERMFYDPAAEIYFVPRLR